MKSSKQTTFDSKGNPIVAAENPFVSAEVYDINHFGDLKDKYKVMSVPCMIINEDQVVFGKKNIKQILNLIK